MDLYGKVLIALLESGTLPLIIVVLLTVIGFLIWLITNKSNKDNGYVDSAIEGMKAMLQEQHAEMEKLSTIVYKFKLELESEKQKSFSLQTEIIELKQENLKLKTLISELEALVRELQAENARLKGME